MIRAEAAGTSLGTEIDDVIDAILVSRFSCRTVPEICTMGGITVEDFSSSVAYREIFGLGRQEGRQVGRQEGRQEGRQAEAAALTLPPGSNAVAARSTPTSRTAFRPYTSAPLKPWPMPCSISRVLKISRPG